MKFLFILIAFLTLNLFSFGQLNMTSPNNGVSNPLNCSTYNSIVANFFDNGTSTNYANSFSDTLTVCPDLTNGYKVSFSSLTADSYIWNVDPTDTLYIFDGSSTSAPLVAAINSGTHPTGFAYTSSFTNLSGCLTFVFHSNAAANNIGWSANIKCSSPAQPIDINLEAYKNGEPVDLLIADSIFIDLCLGDTLILTIDPDYINSLETTGVGYSQNDGNVNVGWVWSTGETFTAEDTVQYIATNSSGFISSVYLTDALLHTSSRDVFIRVGTIPNFGGLFPTPDTVCIGDQTVLYGGFDITDTTQYGFTIPPAVFTIGGAVAQATYLPDGNGQSYTTDIAITGFDPFQTLTPTCNVDKICLEIEHSYVGDLIATITCPNGSTATLFDGNNVSPLNTFLGEAYDDDASSVIGIGYTYCFTDNGTSTFANAPHTTLTAPPATFAGETVTPGQYIPQNLFSTTLAGCPLNGIWTITITDDQGSDDGWIFNWSLAFAACNYGDSLQYQNYAVSGEYINVNPILSQTDSTLTTIVQNPGNNGYQFHVVDDFGCPHDTTINVFAHFVDVIETDTVCNNDDLTMSTNFASTPGTWSFYNSAGTPTFSSNTNVNTTVSFDVEGIYHLVYTGTLCGADTATIYYQGYVPFNFNAPFINCPNTPKEFEIQDSLNFASVDWNLGLPSDNEFTNALGNGTYTVNGIGNNGCPYDTTFTVTSQPPIVLSFPGLPTFCGWSLPDTMEMILNTGVEPGQWTFIGPTNGVTFVDDNVLNTDAVFSQYGTYSLIFTEPTCLDDDTLTVAVTPGVYFNILDYDLCDGSSLEILTDIALPQYVTSMQWNTGATTPSITVTDGGYYTFTISNACQSMTDSSLITLLDCNITMPNVFTPNGDGKNDVYKIITNAEGIFKNFHIVITNRWGNLIHEYDNVEGIWDGTTSSGKIAGDGVYFYSVKATTIQDEEVIKQGFIHLISQ